MYLELTNKTMKKKKKQITNDLLLILQEHMNENGIKMIKKLTDGGFISNSVYDERTVHSYDDLFDLIKDGFTVNEDLGVFMFNALLNSHRKTN